MTSSDAGHFSRMVELRNLHRLHSSPQPSPPTRTTRPGRCVWRKLRRSRWLACSPEAGSPSVHTRKNLWNLPLSYWPTMMEWLSASGRKGCTPSVCRPHLPTAAAHHCHRSSTRGRPQSSYSTLCSAPLAWCHDDCTQHTGHRRSPQGPSRVHRAVSMETNGMANSSCSDFS